MLVEEMREIEVHLAERNRIDFRTGKRMATKPYWVWRNKALYAMMMKQREMRRLKAWLRHHKAADLEKLLVDMLYRYTYVDDLDLSDIELLYKESGYFKKRYDTEFSQVS